MRERFKMWFVVNENSITKVLEWGAVVVVMVIMITVVLTVIKSVI